MDVHPLVTAWLSQLDPTPAPSTLAVYRKTLGGAFRVLDPLTCGTQDLTNWVSTHYRTKSTREATSRLLRRFFGWLTDVRARPDNPMDDPRTDHRIAAWATWRRGNGIRETTIRLHVSVLRRLASVVDLDTATAGELAGWMASNRQWSPETRNTALSAVRSYFGWAHDSGTRPDNPASTLRRVKVPPPDPRPVPEQVLHEVLDEVAADPQARLMVLLAAHAGLRRAEIAGLRRDHLDGDLLRVRGKGGKVRTVPVSGELLDRLIACPPGWIFPGRFPGQHVCNEYVGQRLSQLLPPGYTAHKLRHRFATRVYHRTGDLLILQSLMGHASPVTTRTYVRIDTDDLRRVAAAAL